MTNLVIYDQDSQSIITFIRKQSSLIIEMDNDTSDVIVAITLNENATKQLKELLSGDPNNK